MPLLCRHWPRLRPQTRTPRTTEPRYTAHHTTKRAQIARETTGRPPRNRHTSAEPVAGTPPNTWPRAFAKASSADLRTHLPHRRNEPQGRDRGRVAQGIDRTNTRTSPGPPQDGERAAAPHYTHARGTPRTQEPPPTPPTYIFRIK